MYSKDLNNEHLNDKLLIQMSSIQMVVWYSDHHLNTALVFKWCSEYRTKFSPVFIWHSNNGPFRYRTAFDHLNTRLVQYSDPLCIHSKSEKSIRGGQQILQNSLKHQDWANNSIRLFKFFKVLLNYLTLNQNN